MGEECVDAQRLEFTNGWARHAEPANVFNVIIRRASPLCMKDKFWWVVAVLQPHPTIDFTKVDVVGVRD